MRIDAVSSERIFLSVYGKYFISYTNLQQLEGFSAEVQNLSSLVAKPLRHRGNTTIFLFSHFQSWLLHKILRILIILSS